MKKRLIALRGKSGVGKSSSIYMLYRRLVTESSNKPLSFTSIGRKFDFKAIVLVGGYKVGLVNRGDTSTVLRDYLIEFVTMRCDVIVCAARTKGASIPCSNPSPRAMNSLRYLRNPI